MARKPKKELPVAEVQVPEVELDIFSEDPVAAAQENPVVVEAAPAVAQGRRIKGHHPITKKPVYQ